ncbi:MAG: 4'-phosphopantetheinyl transferase superfamily protein [Lachnospiraceae bacterium]|nr:4'-phosphopantetheinyl transferase superfamily protein [Lachnospiraceae bacterium]
MITVFYADTAGAEASELVAKYLDSIDAQHRAKVTAYKPVRSKNLSLAAAILLQVGVRALTDPEGLDNDLFSTGDDGIAFLNYDDFLLLYEPLKLTYDTGEYGKPSLRGLNDLPFSISHSGTVAALSIGDEESGMDVQYHRPANYMRIAERFFTEEEVSFLRAARSKTSEEHALHVFHDLWSAKEAFVKYTGEGLFRPFDDFSAQLRYTPGAPLQGVIEPDGASLLYPIEIPDYSFSLCTKNEPDVRVLRVVVNA